MISSIIKEIENLFFDQIRKVEFCWSVRLKDLPGLSYVEICKAFARAARVSWGKMTASIVHLEAANCALHSKGSLEESKSCLEKRALGHDKTKRAPNEGPHIDTKSCGPPRPPTFTAILGTLRLAEQWPNLAVSLSVS